MSLHLYIISLRPCIDCPIKLSKNIAINGFSPIISEQDYTFCYNLLINSEVGKILEGL